MVSMGKFHSWMGEAKVSKLGAEDTWAPRQGKFLKVLQAIWLNAPQGPLQISSTPKHYQIQVQKKHVKNFGIKNFGAPKTPPTRNSLCKPFSCVLKGKKTPNIKNLRGQGSLEGGGSGRGGFWRNSICLCAFLVPEKSTPKTLFPVM